MCLGAKRGNLVLVDFGERSEVNCQAGRRPAIVVQNNTGNRFSPTTIVIPLTSKDKNKMPVHYRLKSDYDLALSGNVAMAEQLSVIDKNQIIKVGAKIDEVDLKGIDRIIAIQLNLKAI